MAGPGTDLAQAATDLIEAFNRADWERFRGLLAPDVVYAETGTGRRVEGADAYLQLVAWKEAATRRGRHDPSGDLHGRHRGAILWEGTHTGPLRTPGRTLEPTGQRISVDASVWSRFADGLVREVHHYLDVLMLLQQIGAIPTEPAA
jgi:ketosteroid isomerase-like protein